jgi:hypothetical protein
MLGATMMVAWIGIEVGATQAARCCTHTLV